VNSPDNFFSWGVRPGYGDGGPRQPVRWGAIGLRAPVFPPSPAPLRGPPSLPSASPRPSTAPRGTTAWERTRASSRTGCATRTARCASPSQRTTTWTTTATASPTSTSPPTAPSGTSTSRPDLRYQTLEDLVGDAGNSFQGALGVPGRDPAKLRRLRSGCRRHGPGVEGDLGRQGRDRLRHRRLRHPDPGRDQRLPGERRPHRDRDRRFPLGAAPPGQRLQRGRRLRGCRRRPRLQRQRHPGRDREGLVLRRACGGRSSSSIAPSPGATASGATSPARALWTWRACSISWRGHHGPLRGPGRRYRPALRERRRPEPSRLRRGEHLRPVGRGWADLREQGAPPGQRGQRRVRGSQRDRLHVRHPAQQQRHAPEWARAAPVLQRSRRGLHSGTSGVLRPPGRARDPGVHRVLHLPCGQRGAEQRGRRAVRFVRARRYRQLCHAANGNGDGGSRPERERGPAAQERTPRASRARASARSPRSPSTSARNPWLSRTACAASTTTPTSATPIPSGTPSATWAPPCPARTGTTGTSTGCPRRTAAAPTWGTTPCTGACTAAPLRGTPRG
jgi:hypothetical protein